MKTNVTYTLSGPKLRAARVALGKMLGQPVTQKEIAERCGLIVGNYARMEIADEGSNPSLDISAKVARALGASIESLLDERNPARKKR